MKCAPNETFLCGIFMKCASPVYKLSKIMKKSWKKKKVEILFRQFYKEMYCQAVAERLFDLSRCIIQFASKLLFQIDFKINENPWKSMGNWQNLMPTTEFHEMPSTLACCSSELRRFREMLRHNFNTYSRRSLDCRVPYSTTMVGRKTPSRYIQKYFSISRSRNSAIPTIRGQRYGSRCRNCC